MSQKQPCGTVYKFHRPPHPPTGTLALGFLAGSEGILVARSSQATAGKGEDEERRGELPGRRIPLFKGRRLGHSLF